MLPGTVIVIAVSLVLVIVGLTTIVVRAILDQPHWRDVVLPGFTFKVAGNVPDAVVADALLRAIEAVAPVYTRDSILVALDSAQLHVNVMDVESWFNIGGVKVGGETERNFLRVNHSLSSLCHELIHYLQWALEGREDGAHATWDARIWRADETYRQSLK